MMRLIPSSCKRSRVQTHSQFVQTFESSQFVQTFESSWTNREFVLTALTALCSGGALPCAAHGS